MKWINQTTFLVFAVCLGQGFSATAGPNIVMQPANQRTYSGGNVMFSVYSDDTNPLSYQWVKGGNAIAGATDPRLVLRNVSVADVDSYSVVVSDGIDSTVSSNAVLTLYADGNVMPSSGLLSTQLVSLSRIKAVACGYNNGLALRYDGTVLTFGTPITEPYQGSFNIYSYLPPGLTNACAIAVGSFSFGMALETNGVPRVWAYEASREIPVPAEAHDVVDIAATSSSALALRADGTVICWPFQNTFNSFTPDSITDAVAISASAGVASVLRRDGTVLEWNQVGMLQFTNDVTNVCKLTTGNIYSVARLQDGQVIAWFHAFGGYNGAAQTNVVMPLPAPPPNIVEFVPDSLQALSSDGSLESLQFYPTPVNALVGLGPVGHVSSAQSGYVAIRQADTPVIFNVSIAPLPVSVAPPGPPLLGSIVQQSVKLLPGQANKLIVNAAGRAPLSYQWFKDSKAIPGATESALQLRGLTTESGLYSVQVRNRAGATMSQTFAVYVEQPALTVSGLPSYRTTNDTAHYEGTYPVGNTLNITFYPPTRSIPSRPGVTNVVASPPAPTLETNGATVSWSVDIPLRAGTNAFMFWNSGPDQGATIMREVYRVVHSTISMVTTGGGVIVPNLDGQELELSKTYTVRAHAGAGYYFAGWSEGSTNSAILLGGEIYSPTLTFNMTSNLVVTANFTNSPFPQLQGTYCGLVYAYDGIEHDTSGYIEVRVGSSGAFTGRLSLGGVTYRFGGSFLTPTETGYFINSPGTSTTLYLQRRGKAPLQLWLTIGSGLSGFVTDNYSSSGIMADKSVYDTNQARQYTLAFLGSGGAETNSPLGNGYATVWVNATGRLTMVGSLADGTPISQSTGVSSTGQWPLYVPLYNGKGSMISWVNLSGAGFSSPMSWSRPADPKGGLFSAGFTNAEVTVAGSWYNSTGNIFGFVDGSFGYASEDGTVYGTDACTVLANGALSIDPSSGDHLEINVNRRNGTFSGSFVAPDNQQVVSVHGVLLRFSRQAFGYYLRTNQSGAVWMQ